MTASITDSWSERKTIDIDFFEILNNNIDVLDYSMVRIKVPWQVTIFDVGSLCYTVRKQENSNPNSKQHSEVLVDNSCYMKSRIPSIKNFVEFLCVKYSTGMRESTLNRYVYGFRKFIDWCDNNRQENILNNVVFARKSFDHYVIYLTELTRSSQLNINTASRYQNQVKEILTYLFDDNNGYLTEGLRLLRKSSSANSATQPPSISKVRQAVDIYLSVFNQIADFILKSRRYPFQLKMSCEDLWVFPTSKPTATKLELSYRNEWKKGFWAWDYEKGCLSKSEDIRKHYTGDHRRQKDAVRIILKSANKVLSEANDDYRHFYRRRLALLAAEAFTMLFISNTGMNLSQINSLRWGGDYNVDKEYQGYRTIKYRSNNKPQEFIVTSSFLPLFRKYLKLRAYLVSDSVPLLFFTLDGALASAKPLPQSFSMYFNQKLRNNVGMSSPRVTAREWRAHKADWLIRNTDPGTTAIMLQSSERTVLKHYAEGSDSVCAEEMTNFYDCLDKISYSFSEVNASSTEIPAGHCNQYDSPEPDANDVPILPKCSTASSCLYCSHHRVIVDETDIRKLLSLRFLTIETRQLAANEAHFVDIVGPMLDRIETILNSIASADKTHKLLIERIRKEVTDEERLDPYWARKYQLLIDLDLLT